MGNKKVNIQEFFQYLINQTSGPIELEELVKKITCDSHPSDHKFEENKRFPGTCDKCGWIDPAAETSCHCGRGLVEHTKVFPQQVMDAIAGSIEIVVVEINLGSLN